MSFDSEKRFHFKMKDKSCDSLAKTFDIGYVNSPDSKETFGFIIMEYYPKKNLFKYVERNLTVGNERLCNFIFTKLLDGIFFMHHIVGISHRDIKPDNVVLDANYEPKFIDFGLSEEAMQLQTYDDGTAYYRSPEMFLAEEYFTPKTDMFALGVLLFRLVFGVPPLKTFNRDDLHTDSELHFFDMLTSGNPDQVKRYLDSN
jgi:serine/threonine protein kinase